MDNTVSLYRMELRKNRNFFLIILAVQFVLIAAQLAVKITQYVNGNSLDPFNVFPITSLLIQGAFFAFPFMLLHSWYREEKDMTNYQVLSSPVLPQIILKSKLKAFLSVCMIWIVLYTIDLAVIDWMRMSHISHRDFEYSSLLTWYLHHFSNMFLLLGFMCLIISVLQIIKQRRLITLTASLFIGVMFYLTIQKIYRLLLRYVYNVLFYGFFNTHQGFSLFSIRTLDSLLPLLIGVVCIYTGFYFFDRYSEV